MSFTPSQPSGSTGTFTTYTSVSGARATSNVGSSAAKRDVDEALLTHKPYQTPIFQELVGSARKKPTGNQKFEWMISSLLPRTDTVTVSGGAANEDNISVGDSTLYQVGTKFVIDSTGEVCIVDSIASSQIDVTKVGSGNITAASSASIHFLGDSFEQGSSSATAKSVNKEFPYNYVENAKKAVEITDSQKATVEYGPDDWDNQKMDRMEEFKMDWESKFLYGVRSSGTGVQNGSFTQFETGGVMIDTTSNFIQQLYAYSSLTESYFFDTFLKGWFTRGSNRKRLYCGATVLTTINNFQKVLQQTRTSDTVYGVKLGRILCPYGEVELVWHPMLDGTTFTQQALGIDLGGDYIKYRYLAGNGESRDFNFVEYPHFAETERRKGEWKAEAGLQVQAPEYHAILQPS